MGELELSEALFEQYRSSCEICGTFPDPAIARQFAKGIVLLNPQKLHYLSVEPICHALSQKITPFFITVEFTDFRKTSKEETEISQKILKGVFSCLVISKTISRLKFVNLSFSANLLQKLCQGLSQVKRLQHLAFEDCFLNRPKCIEKICQAIKNSSSIACLVFKNCGVDLSGAKAVKSLIMVCCFKIEPDIVGITTTTPNNGEKLLPKDCGNPITEDRIFGGTKAPIGAYPWMVALGYTDVGLRGDPMFNCAGALISSRYVLTAAHCIDKGALGARQLSVVHLGDWDLSTNQDCQVTGRGQKCSSHIVAGYEELILHPMYDKRTQTSDDIGLIRLNISIDFRDPKVYAEPVCLPPKGLSARAAAQGRDPLAAGWGLTEHGNQSNILLRVNIPFADISICKDVYDTRFLENEQLCVGGGDDQDTCSGDSGAPLVLPGPSGPPYLQIGIVSYGSLPCALGNIPAVYTAVSGYRDWIVQNLKP